MFPRLSQTWTNSSLTATYPGLCWYVWI